MGVVFTNANLIMVPDAGGGALGRGDNYLWHATLSVDYLSGSANHDLPGATVYLRLLDATGALVTSATVTTDASGNISANVKLTAAEYASAATATATVLYVTAQADVWTAKVNKAVSKADTVYTWGTQHTATTTFPTVQFTLHAGDTLR